MKPSSDNQTRLAREIIRSIRMKSLALLILSGTGAVFAAILGWGNQDFFVEVLGDEHGGRFLFIPVLLVMAMCQWLALRYLRRHFRLRGEDPVGIGYINAVLEPSLVSLLLLIEMVNFQPDALIVTPMLLGYAVVITLSSLHLSWRITLATSAVCALEYLLLLAMTERIIGDSVMAQYLPGQEVKSLLLVLIGATAAFVAWRARRGAADMTRSHEEKSFVKRVMGRYLTDDVTEHLLKAPQGLQLGGEKRTVSLMLSDLRGFTQMSERLPAEIIVSMLNHYLAEMIEIIDQHQGTIDEIIGDAILVVFGAPVAAEQHAEMAVRCAIAMQQAMPDINRWNRQHGFPEITMGIGIHSGSVIVGNIGSEKRSKYGVVGKAINLTSRIESRTVGGQVLVSQTTARMIGERLHSHWQREVLLKGMEDAVVIVDVHGLTDQNGRLWSLPERSEALHLLSVPLLAEITVMEDKKPTAQQLEVQIHALSAQEALAHSDIPLLPLTDVQLRFSDFNGMPLVDLAYAKVVDQQADGMLICFTSLGEKTQHMLKALLHQQSGYDQ
jgi:class 3 adenylate cyclase